MPCPSGRLQGFRNSTPQGILPLHRIRAADWLGFFRLSKSIVPKELRCLRVRIRGVVTTSVAEWAVLFPFPLRVPASAAVVRKTNTIERYASA